MKSKQLQIWAGRIELGKLYAAFGQSQGVTIHKPDTPSDFWAKAFMSACSQPSNEETSALFRGNLPVTLY